MGLALEETGAIHGNHVEVTKFVVRDGGYNSILSTIERWIELWNRSNVAPVPRTSHFPVMALALLIRAFVLISQSLTSSKVQPKDSNTSIRSISWAETHDFERFRWRIIIERFAVGIQQRDSETWKSGVYCSLYPSDGNEAVLRLDIDWDTVKESASHWSEIAFKIIAPKSSWYPGEYNGVLHGFDDYPFQPPKVLWKTPIFTPYIDTKGFMKDGILGREDWNTTMTLKEILQSFASIVVFGPYPYHGGVKEGDLVQYSVLNKASYTFMRKKGEDSMRRATNFFARAFTEDRSESEPVSTPEPPVLHEQLAESRLVITELLDFINNILFMQAETNNLTLAALPPEAFRHPMTYLDWRVAEKEWADTLWKPLQ